MLILSIDPGRKKFGYALLKEGKTLKRGILPVGEFPRFLEGLRDVEKIVLGKGTGWQTFREMVNEAGLYDKLEVVEEEMSTMRARRRFLEEYPPRGLKGLLRKWLNLPGRDVDDISAQIIGEDYWEKLKKTH